MVSSLETGLSANTYWGYWEIAFNAPGSGNDYHLHVPGALWIAGEQTPAAQVQSLIDSPPAGILTYAGGAKGIMIDPGTFPQVSELSNGSATLNVDFGGRNITGSINFSQVSMTLTVAAAEFLTTGFTGIINEASTSSRVGGAFFGSDAQGVGGISQPKSAVSNTRAYLPVTDRQAG